MALEQVGTIATILVIKRGFFFLFTKPLFYALKLMSYEVKTGMSLVRKKFQTLFPLRKKSLHIICASHLLE